MIAASSWLQALLGARASCPQSVRSMLKKPFALRAHADKDVRAPFMISVPAIGKSRNLSG
jgi:hypothetical protein